MIRIRINGYESVYLQYMHISLIHFQFKMAIVSLAPRIETIAFKLTPIKQF